MKKLAELKSKSKRLAIIHPTEGNLETWIEVLGLHSHEYRTAIHDALKERGSKVELTATEGFQETANVLSNIIVDWDKEFFEADPTTDNIRKVLKDQGNSWLVSFIETELSKVNDFFGNG